MNRTPWVTRAVTRPNNNPNGTLVYQGIAPADKEITEVTNSIIEANKAMGRKIQELKLERRFKSIYG